jgi:Ca2+:H+ antiporter
MEWIKKVGWLNVLLVFLPVALVLEWTHADGAWIFLTACVAIIPLAGLMGKSTEIIAERLGPGIGGLMNASFGNAAELIIAFFALKAGHITVVKASITGSILGNVLLVLGLSFLAGGVRFQKQSYNPTAAGVSATLMALAAIGLVVPAVFHGILVNQGHVSHALERNLSLEICIVLFVTYALNLIFSLVTHKHLYSPEHGEPHGGTHGGAHGGTHAPAGPAAGPDTSPAREAHEATEHWPQWVAITVLIAATVGVALMSEVLVGAIEQARAAFGWTELFVGVIIIAIVGNAAEHSTAILVAWKNKMDLSFQIAVGSGLQIAMFVAPVLVFASYLPGFPELDLIFSPLEVIAVGVSVLVVGLVAHDGESNWLEGLLLLAVYLILGIAFYNLPEEAVEHAAEIGLSILRPAAMEAGCPV